jgi:hypothetical protein
MLRDFWDWYLHRPCIHSSALTNPSSKMITALGLRFPEVSVEKVPELFRTSLVTSFSLLLAAIIQFKSDVGLSKVDQLIVLNASASEVVGFYSFIIVYSYLWHKYQPFGL